MQLWFNAFYEYFAQSPLIDIIAVVFGIIYVLLAARNHIACWFFGIIGSSLAMYSVYYNYQLYIETFLQFFYIVTGVIGWIHWNKKKGEEPIPITRMKIHEHLILILTGISGTLLFGWIFKTYTEAAATYIDAYTTVFALLTTFLVVNRKLENWLYWIAIDSVSLYLYHSRSAHFYVILFVVYLIVAAIGYFQWLKIYKKQGVEASVEQHLVEKVEVG